MRRSCLMGLMLALLMLVSADSVPAQQASDTELRIEPPKAVIAVGEKTPFKVFLALPSGERSRVKEVSWRVEPEGIGRIGPEGVFGAGDGPGEGTITAVASIEGRRLKGEAKIVVDRGERGAIAGRVVSAVGKVPVSRAEVIVQGVEAPERQNFRAFTDEKGIFEIGVRFGAYRVCAKAPGFVTEFFEDAEAPDAAGPVVLDEEVRAIRLTFELASEYTISGGVADASDDPVVRGEVVATRVHLGLPEGLLQPNELRERLTDRLREVTGELSDRLGDLSISDPEAWRERLTENVESSLSRLPLIRRVARISEEGTYLLEGLAKGAYIVAARAPGYLPKVYGQDGPDDRPDPVEVPLPEDMAGLDFVLDRGASVSGTVKDANGVELERARVTAVRLGRRRYEQAAITDANGIYEIAGLAPGEYIVRAAMSGYTPELYEDARDRREATPVEVVANAVVEGIDFSLDRSGAIFGVVSGADDAGISGAMVRVRAVAGFLDRRVSTDEAGAYLMDGLPTADYRIGVFARGFEPSAPQIVRVLDGEHTEFNVTLAAWGSIRGTVASGGVPLAGAEVVARAVDENVKLRARTDENGAYRIEKVRSGAYVVWAGARGYQAEFHPDATGPNDAEQVTVELSEDIEGIDFDLAKLGALSGTVAAADGSELRGAWADVTARGSEQKFARRARAEEDGTYLVPDLPPGEYIVRAGAFGYLSTFYTGDTPDVAEPVDVALSQEVTGIDIVLPKGGAISGLVLTDDNGRPIRGAAVTARSLDEVEGRRAKTNELGTYEIVGLRTGRYLVHVEARGFVSEFYDDASVPDRAEIVEIAAPEVLSGISFGLTRRWPPSDVVGPGVLAGTVRNIQDGTPLAGVLVVLKAGEKIFGTALTGQDGEYRVDRIPPGTYVLASERPGYEGVSVSATIRSQYDSDHAPEPLVVDLSMRPVEMQDGQNPAGVLLGDVSRNGSVTPYDASLILKSTVGMLASPDPEDPNVVAETADVSGDGSVGAYDAALILQYSVGLIDRFPSAEGAGKVFAGHRSLGLGPPYEMSEGRRAIPLLLDRRDGVLSGEIELRFDPSALRVTEVASEYLLISAIEGDRIRVAFAGTHWEEGPGEIASVVFEPTAADLFSALHIEAARLNEGAFEVDLSSRVPAEPPRLHALFPSYPNPFNPETTIPYEIERSGTVHLAVYGLTGQCVRTLVDAELPAGRYSVVWDGRDDAGRDVSSGVYLCRMIAGEFSAVRKLLLVR